MDRKVLNRITVEDLSPECRNGERSDYFAVLDVKDIHFVSIDRKDFEPDPNVELTAEELETIGEGNVWVLTNYYRTDSIMGFYGFTHVEFDFEEIATKFAEVVGPGGAFCIGPKDNFEEAKDLFSALRDSGELTRAIERYAIDEKGSITVGGFNPEDCFLLDYVGGDYLGRPVYEVFGSYIVKEVEGRPVSFSAYVKDIGMGQSNAPYLHWSSPRTYFEGEPDYPLSYDKPLRFVSTLGLELPENAQTMNQLVWREIKHDLDAQVVEARETAEALRERQDKEAQDRSDREER